MPDMSPKATKSTKHQRMGKPERGCPLTTHVDDFVRKSQSLAVSVRTLRKEFARCSSCHQYQSCTLRESFQDRIRAAVSELTDEWNLSESF